MKEIVHHLSQINDKLNALVSGIPMIVLILGTGILFSVKTKFFQITKIGHILKITVLSLLKKDINSSRKSGEKKSISQFQALSTALAATIGTGSIAGVATAITIGGAGAVFWMWVSAFFGMMTVFAENVLGIYYRKRNEKGEWVGGAMYYIQYGLGTKWLAIMFSIFCVCASFGMGNMAQSNSISDAMSTTFNVPNYITGIVTAALVGVVILGGIKRIGRVAEMVIPFISIVFVVMCLIILLYNIKNIPSVLRNIVCEAFGFKEAAGGISGAIIARAVSIGVKRGVFSNEAGLGSSVMAHCACDVKEPVVQGMWGVLEVFIDTMVVCTLTALVILSSGNILNQGADGSALVILSFQERLGNVGGIFITLSIIIFAFATLIGWSYFGEKAMEYIFGTSSIKIYKVIFVSFVYVGAVLKLSLVWGISDTLNGLMAIPNLIALWLLSALVSKITADYLERKKTGFRYKDNAMYSAYDKELK